MKTINISVRDKLPFVTSADGSAVADNKYRLKFKFDDEWVEGLKTVIVATSQKQYTAYPTVTDYVDVVLDNARTINVGIIQDTVATSRPCQIIVNESIRRHMGEEIAPPEPDVWEYITNQIRTLSALSVRPVDKQDTMTQQVGKDADGKLWTFPGGGGSSAGIAGVSLIPIFNSNGGPIRYALEIRLTNGESFVTNLPDAGDTLEDIVTVSPSSPIDAGAIGRVGELWFDTSERMLYVCVVSGMVLGVQTWLPVSGNSSSGGTASKGVVDAVFLNSENADKSMRYALFIMLEDGTRIERELPGLKNEDVIIIAEGPPDGMIAPRGKLYMDIANNGQLYVCVESNSNGSQQISRWVPVSGGSGISPTVSVSAITGGHRITITDKNSTKTVDVMDGADGDPGQPGTPGRGIVSVLRTSGNGAAGTVDTYTITYTDGTTSTFAVYNGKDGTPYVLTAADKSAIAAEAAELVSVPVLSVNGKTGAVVIDAGDVNADPAGTASGAVTGHNVSEAAHNDIRLLITGLTNRLNALANSTDEDLDQLAEIVTYIKANKTLIDSITTSKVSVTDIIDNLTTSVSNKPLSAKMGVQLKALIDAIKIPTSLPASDVYSWAKQPQKPTYTASEVGAATAQQVADLSEEIADQRIPYIIGDSTTSGTWTGACEDIMEYREGLTVLYKINIEGNSGGTTLNINGLGAIPVKRNASTAVTTIYPVGTVLMLTYSDGAWLTADYDANTKNTAGTSNKVDTKMYLAGATSQTSSGTTTYTNKNVYIGTDNCLYSNGEKVATDAQFESVSEAIAGQGKTLGNAVLYIPQNLTEAQKAQVRANIGATAGEEVEFADSVDWLNENGDTSKKYVLPDGFIYAYMQKSEIIPHNAYSDEYARYNNRPTPNATKDDNTPNAGYYTTLPIEIDNSWTDCVVNISGVEKLVENFYTTFYVFFYKADGSWLGYHYAGQYGFSDTSQTLPISVNIKYNQNLTYWNQAKYVRIALAIKAANNSLYTEDCQNLVINFERLNGTKTVNGWYSTGQQHSNDKATQQNSADIAVLKEDVADLKEAIKTTPSQSGAVWYALGDSITYGTHSTSPDTTLAPVVGNRWVDYVAKYNGYELTNLGVSGSGFVTGTTLRTVIDSNDFSAVDLVTLMIGVNDWKNADAVNKVGTMADAVGTTYTDKIIPEMRYAIERIISQNPFCKIIFITPINARVPYNSATEAANWSYGFENSYYPCGTFINFIEKLTEVCKYYNVQVIDLTDGCIVNRKNINSVLPDGLHPNLECYKALGLELARRITFA